jgi:hypothetical protein
MALNACGSLFDGGSKKYSVAYKARNSKMVDRSAVIDRIAGSIGEEHVVDLVNPEIVIVYYFRQINVLVGECLV